MSLESLERADRFADLAGLLESCEVGGFRADFLSTDMYRPEYWRNYWHSHSFHEVCLAYAGSGRFSIGDTSYDVGAGEAFLARPGDVHEIESSKADPLGIVFWGFTFRPNATTAGSTATPGWWSGLTRASGPVVSTRVGALPALVTAIAGEADRPRSGYETGLGALASALVLDTARAFAIDEDLAVDPPPRDRGVAVVTAMQRHLLDNLARPVTVREVAAAVHLSDRHAERLFRQQTGTSLMTELRRMRMELAAQLLLDPASTVTEVARACGYGDVRPFSTAFRRFHGKPPSVFRTTGGTEHLPRV
ncbi:helix-turn-helix domain-containing protein [Kribbella deserti]|uniref:Helix-turn-helix domain-containing protein n=1 Tax=Kribbella deserti TaxID=1926257 RepID=A0ABV6QDN8_9ACTN